MAWHKFSKHVDRFLFSVSVDLLFTALIASLGSDVHRAGTKVTARGRVDTPTGKEAIGAMLDGHVAVMQAEGVPTTARPKNKAKKEKKDKKDKKEDCNKQVQKDVKGYLVSKSHVGNRT